MHSMVAPISSPEMRDMVCWQSSKIGCARQRSLKKKEQDAYQGNGPKIVFEINHSQVQASLHSEHCATGLPRPRMDNDPSLFVYPQVGHVLTPPQDTCLIFCSSIRSLQ